MNVICYGDSNTYGYDPRSWLGGHYDADSRWVDILAAETGWTVRNWGEPGQEIPPAAPALPAGTDRLILMLGATIFSRAAARKKPQPGWNICSPAFPCPQSRSCSSRRPPWPRGNGCRTSV